MQKLFSINLVEVQSAIIYGLMTALGAVLAYIVGIGDIFKIDPRSVINIATISFSITIISLIKNFLTDSEGKFVGLIKVK